MNNKKIAFITCVNDEEMYEECVRYIKHLNVPKGYEIDIISIKNAKNMAAAYNDVMNNGTDAKFKVYLHQDTLIINKNFINDILEIFKSDDKVGMLGVVGAKNIPSSAVWWEADEKYGKVYESHTGNMKLLSFLKGYKKYEEVRGIDGLIMVTQYDIHWNEERFDGWHFYDLSQSMEFILSGYKVVVPSQEEPWCIHDCGLVNTKNGYEVYKNRFLDSYSKDFSLNIN